MKSNLTRTRSHFFINHMLYQSSCNLASNGAVELWEQLRSIAIFSNNQSQNTRISEHDAYLEYTRNQRVEAFTDADGTNVGRVGGRKANGVVVL